MVKLFFKAKDGGPDSKVTGYWLIEWKKLFSIVLLRFDRGSREVFHTHAFNAWSWVLSGFLHEYVLNEGTQLVNELYPSVYPIFTARDRLHKVYGCSKRTWVLSFRGPWADKWKEFTFKNKFTTLTHNRVEIPNE